VNTELEKDILAFLDRCVTETDGLRFRYRDSSTELCCPLIKDKVEPLLAKLKAAKEAVNKDGTCGTCETFECCIRTAGGSCSRYTKAIRNPQPVRLPGVPYYVEGWGGWFVVRAKDARAARSEGVKEFGRGKVKSVRKATLDEIKSFVANKSEQAMER
jgi:hypothetical protein